MSPRLSCLPWWCQVVADHRLFLTFVGSSVCASATQRTIAAAKAGNALGVGCGQLWVSLAKPP